MKDEIEYRGISQIDLSRRMQMPYRILNDILNQRRQLTTKTAMMFEAALDIPADSLMRLQLKYNMQMAQNDSKFKKKLDEIRKFVAAF